MAYRKIDKDGFTIYENENGKQIATATGKIIEIEGLVFRDLEGTGELLPYEDWRLDSKTRAMDLAGRLTVEEMAGLMMYSPHQLVPGVYVEPFVSTYDGKTREESGAEKWSLTDQQKIFLKEDHVRYVLARDLESTEVAAKWNNEMQRFVEELPHGIPVNISSDPRHTAARAAAEFKSEAADVSRWPEGMGMAAAFSPKQCENYAKIISREYRAMGIATALSPQIDTATEPRWMRFEDTFGSHPSLVTDYARAYCDGMQTTEGAAEEGWGKDSVSAMVKHWPGGATGEAGRDAHYAFGCFAVYPGNNFDMHLRSFTQGAFKLNGPTKTAASIMPYYTVSWNQDKKNGLNIGNSYSNYLVHDLLREKYEYEGVVCTDWGITADPDQEIDIFDASRCYGMQDMTEAERHFIAIENGVDQFGGNSDMKPILGAYELGCEKYGEKAMHERMQRSAVRLLMNSFRSGLYDNPYLDVEESKRIVGCEAHQKAGFEAQLKSVVLIKNAAVEMQQKDTELKALPIRTGCKVYIPNRTIKAKKSFRRSMEGEKQIDPVTKSELEGFFTRVENPEEADAAIVFMESPLTDGGYNKADRENGGNGYLPISLQYRPYTADHARKESIAGGDFRESSPNRSYAGKNCITANEGDLDNLIAAREKMGDKPVIVVLRMHNPTIMAEAEPFADAILVEFGVQKKAIFQILTGEYEPTGLLPFQMPEDMETVEKHCEDVPFDMQPYQDKEGNFYDFGFGLDFKGRILDERTKKYTVINWK